MKYAELGNTGIQVSKICIGAMSFGKASQKFLQWTLNQNETEDMIAHAWELGINFIDTANFYGGGTSEEYTGKALRIKLFLRLRFISMRENFLVRQF